MQTRLQSFIETITGTAIGFIVALAAQVFITHWYQIPTSIQQDVWITVFFTGISIIRGYAVRRAFNLAHSGRLKRPQWVSRLLRRLGAVVCRVKGHHYDTPVFRANALYFCTRCGKEMFDRTFADLRAMQPMSADDLEDFHRQIYMNEGA